MDLVDQCIETYASVYIEALPQKNGAVGGPHGGYSYTAFRFVRCPLPVISLFEWGPPHRDRQGRVVTKHRIHQRFALDPELSAMDLLAERSPAFAGTVYFG